MAADGLWLPLLQLLVATLRVSSDRRRRGLLADILTPEEFAHIACSARLGLLGRGRSSSGVACPSPSVAHQGSMHGREAIALEIESLVTAAEQLCCGADEKDE